MNKNRFKVLRQSKDTINEQNAQLAAAWFWTWYTVAIKLDDK